MLTIIIGFLHITLFFKHSSLEITLKVDRKPIKLYFVNTYKKGGLSE